MLCAALCLSPPLSLTGQRGLQPTVSRRKVSTRQACRLLPVFLSVTRRAAWSAAHSVTARCTSCGLCRCAALGPSQASVPSLAGPPGRPPTASLHKVSTVQSPPLSESLTGPRGRVAHSVTTRGVDCAGVLPSASLPFRHSRAAGSAAHSLSVTARGVDNAGVLPQARLAFCHSQGRGVGQPTVSRHEMSTVQATSSRCAASCPSSVLSLTGPRRHRVGPPTSVTTAGAQRLA